MLRVDAPRMLAAICSSMAIFAIRGSLEATAPLNTTRMRRSPFVSSRISSAPSGNTRRFAALDLGLEKISLTSPSSTTRPSSRIATRLQISSTTLI